MWWIFIAGALVGFVGGGFVGVSLGFKLAYPYILQALQDEGFELIAPKKDL